MNNTHGQVIFVIILVLVGIFLLHLYRKHFKSIILPNVLLISGAVKSGKSLLSVHYARKVYRRNLFSYYVGCFFNKLFHLGKDLEKPMLYSNIKLARTDFNLLSMDIILRKVRIPAKSVVLMDEASLIADSMMYQDKEINNALTLFVKLFAHYSHNGTLIINTQSVADLHYSFKRCINQYLYVSKRLKLPFVSVLWVREMFYASDNNTINTSNSDVDDGLKKILIWNSSYRLYDSLCYSSFTDYLPVKVCYTYEKMSKDDDLKCYCLVSFQDFAVRMNKECAKAYGFDNDSSVVPEKVEENKETENVEEGEKEDEAYY